MHSTRFVILTAILFVTTENLFAAVYYVSRSGDDSDPGTKSSPWKTIAKANSFLAPGDTVLIRNGEYNEIIQPRKSGTEGAPITYKAYNSETPIITNSPGGKAIVLDNRSYITVDGLSVTGKAPFNSSNLKQWVSMSNSNHIAIQNCDFKYAKGWIGIALSNSHYNKIRNNRMDYLGEWDDGTGNDSGDMVGVFCSNYNIIENNELTRGGHNLMDVNGDFNVIRNNVFDNKWSEAKGNRALTLDANRKYCATSTGFNLFEDNMVRNALPASDNPRPPAMKVEGTNQIVRRNIFVNIRGAAFKADIRTPKINEVSRNKVYHNTVYNADLLWELTDFNSTIGVTDGNVYKNNILYQYSGDMAININIKNTGISMGNGPLNNTEVIANVFRKSETTTDAPMMRFVGVGTQSLDWFQAKYPENFADNIRDVPNFSSNSPTRLEDFNLKKGSALIDKGAFLTRTTRAGSGKEIRVEDAGYFSDGFGIIPSDSIQVGNNQSVKITRIDYDRNLIIVGKELSWEAGEGVSLPYKGDAPDIGAYEFHSGVKIPVGLRLDRSPKN